MKKIQNLEVSKFRVENSLKDDYLEQMLKLDESNYSEDDKGTYSMCMDWYSVNNDIYIILLYDNKVVGYINFIALTKEAYQKFKTAQIRDTDLTSKDILPFVADKENYCLFMSIVIHPNFRNGDAVKILTKAWQYKLQQLEKKGVKIKSILADCVSEDGERYIKRLGFESVIATSHDSIIYEKSLRINSKSQTIERESCQNKEKPLL
ncbi:TPA: hypothetical protein GXZ34_04735 [bacterium]|nr:hypothetical protein [bacterium]